MLLDRVVLGVNLRVTVAMLLQNFNHRFLVFLSFEISAGKYHIFLLLNERIITCETGLSRLQHN